MDLSVMLLTIIFCLILCYSFLYLIVWEGVLSSTNFIRSRMGMVEKDG